jgi:orotidine-5'-phosphate decarboxylase
MPDANTHRDARSRLILALDVPRIEDGLSLLDRLQGHIGLVKVGLELFAACGPRAVEEVKARGFGVFLDLKLHDIPNTVAGAVRSARALEVDMLTIHTGGGQEMMKAAAAEAGPKTLILGVTVLTSLGPEDLRDVGICGTLAQVVEARARLASQCGLGGVVCSPKEIANVRNTIAPTMKIITPGIRPSQSEMGDQKRAATPGDAIGSGSDYLVVGRPISQASDPAEAASSIVSEIETALCLQR